jgi:hypothetical protein
MIKTFEELKSHISDLRQDSLEAMADRLEESTEFNRGGWCGYISAYDDILAILRTSLKYGESPEELKEIPAPW